MAPLVITLGISLAVNAILALLCRQAQNRTQEALNLLALRQPPRKCRACIQQHPRGHHT